MNRDKMGSQRQVPFSPSNLVFERKFDTALRKSHSDSFVRRLAAGQPSPDDTALFAAYQHHGSQFRKPEEWVHNVNLYPDILVSVLDANLPRTPDTLNKRICHLAAQQTMLQTSWAYKGMEDKYRPSGKLYTTLVTRKIMRSDLIQRLLLSKRDLDGLVTTIPRADERKRREETIESFRERISQTCHWSSKWLGITVVWSLHSCLVSHLGKTYYLPRSYLLLCHNKVCDVLSVLLYAAACPDHMYDCDLLRVTERFLKTWTMLANRLGQRFFNLSKVLEGLCVGETLIELEGDGNREFLDTITDGLQETARFSYNGSTLQQILQTVSIPVRHELACLSKTMGHPFCDMEKGAAALEQRVNAPKLIDIDAVVQCVRYAKLDFIRKFLAKEKTWPLVDLDVLAPRTLKLACLLNRDPRSTQHQQKYGNFKLEHMDYVTVLPNMRFDWLENLIPYIKDKTISLGRSSVVQKYLSAERRRPTDWKDTRLLLFYLLKPESQTNHMEYMSAYNAGDWEQIANYLVIRVVPKEKEHKIEARGFGCKTYEDRARGIVQEENAARFLNQYSDEHVMTLGEIQLAKKLLGFRTLGAAFQGYTVVLISVDSSSWNNQFRSQTVAPVAGAVLDAVFGVSIFEKTHTAYQRSLVYVPDADRVYSWDGQEGGIEGLNQDTWVYVYLQQMKVCMEGQPYPYFLLCKGDDLRIAMMIPPDVLKVKSLDEIKREALKQVSERGKKFGHVIKVEDSYVSETYFAYSKDAYVAGVEQPQSFRKVQKCYGANNAFLTTIDDYIASAFSNAHSAAKTSPSPIPCYYLALWWSYEALCRDTEYAKCSDDELVALMSVPNLLGGFPIIFLHNFFVRAESDLLTPYIDLVSFSLQCMPKVGRVLLNTLKQKVADPTRCLNGLMVDPYSLPIHKPRPASTTIRLAVTSMVRRKTKNQNLLDLFTLIGEGFEERFIEVLGSANVYNVKLMGALYECTPEGIVRTLIRKFETGRSIFNALLLHTGQGAAHRVLRQCCRADQALHRYRRNLLRGRIAGSQQLVPEEELVRECPYKVASDLRDRLWEKPVEGVTQPSLQHQIMVGTVAFFGASDVAAENHFEVLFDVPSDGTPAPLFTIGKYSPFTGDSTGRGLAPPEASLESHNMLSGKVRTLLEVYQWSQMTGEVDGRLVASNLQIVAEHLLKAYTDTPIQDLLPFAGRTVRDRMTQHHVRVNNYRTSIVANTLLNIYTRASGTSHAHMELSHSSEHYRVNFLHVLTHTVSIWAGVWWYGENVQPPGRLWAVTRPDCPCMAPMEEHPVILADTCLPDITLADIAHLARDAIREIAADVAQFDPGQYYVSEDSETHLSLQEALMALAQAHTNDVWGSRKTLRGLYTSHHLSDRGLSALANYAGVTLNRVSSYLDLRFVPPDVIINDAAFMVYTEIIRRFDTKNIKSMSTFLGTIPGEELPWTGLLRAMDESGVFYSVQMELHKKIPTFYDVIQDNPRSASAAFGAACYELFLKGLTVPKIAYLSYSSNPQANDDMMYRIRGARLHALQRKYRPLMRHVQRASAKLQADILESFCAGLTCIDVVEFDLSTSSDPVLRRTMALFEFDEDFEEDFMSLVHADEDTGELLWQSTDYAQMAAHAFGMPDVEVTEVLNNLCATRKLQDRIDAFLVEMGNPVIEIYRTDLVACANRVRSEKQPLYHLQPTATVFPGTIMPEVKTRGHRTCVVGKFLEGQAATVPPSGYTWKVDEDPEYKGTLFNKRWTLRPLGAGNISMSKAYRLLAALGLDPLPNDIVATALGDGYGGTAAVISALTAGSHIVYNTKPNRQGGTAMPVHALEVAAQRGNRVEYSDIDLGHYDLTEEATFRRFELHVQAVHLVTLDAEVKPIVCLLRLTMLHHVVTFFLRRGVPSSILILKVYVEEAVQWMGLLGRLAPRCRTVQLARNEASSMNGEFYLVAQLEEPVGEEPYRVRSLWPPAVEVERLHKFAYVRYNEDIRLDEGGVNEIAIAPMYTAGWIRMSRLLPLYGWSKMQEVTRVVFPTMCKIRGTASITEWLALIITVLNNAEHDVRGEIQGLRRDKEKYTYDTLQHIVVLLQRYAIIRGFLLVAKVMQRGEVVFTRRDADDGYYQMLIDVSDRIDIVSSWRDHPKGPFEYQGIRMDPHKKWKVGMRWGIQALAISRRL
nr:MAG: polymerase [Chuviridae sp.]